MKCLFQLFLLVAGCVLFLSCKKETVATAQPETGELYFPPVDNREWQTVSASSLGWDEAELNNLYPYLQSKNTKAFLILKNGKIVTEKYFGTFTADSLWYWASAGKTITGLLIGIAQQEGLVDINQRSSRYLGTGWTSAPPEKENLITLRHQLTMTTGLDDGVANEDCTLPACLTYKADAGTRWAYHNAAYTLLDKVVEQASGRSFNAYFREKIRDKIGMNGLWIKTPNANNVFFSNARSMARFGLLLLNNGYWGNQAILNDPAYFTSQVNTSQPWNPAYGYLTWLNGKAGYRLPNSQLLLAGPLFPNAPADLFAALGKNDQKIYVVPSQQLVIIRMGKPAGEVKNALSGFDNELWGKLQVIMKE
ncbi:MAG: serine hydrolase domain-containing protein [Adhaeribacter sp.]